MSSKHEDKTLVALSIDDDITCLMRRLAAELDNPPLTTYAKTPITQER
jgi:hypothetical protein